MSRRGSHTSESVSSAERTAPVAKPSCTEVVSQAAPASSSPHASRSSGTTALAENQRLIANRSTSASSASCPAPRAPVSEERGVMSVC